jgi:hypothetical protein
MKVLLLIFFTYQITLGSSEFYFHWGSRNRIEMLLKHKRLNKKAFDAASFGVKNGAYHGNGFYVSLNPFRWAHLGEQVLLVYSPEITQSKPEPLGKSPNVDFIFKSENSDVLILSLEEGLKLYLKENPSKVNLENLKDLIKICFKNGSPLGLSIIENFKNNPEIQKDVKEYIQKIFPSVHEDLKLYTAKLNSLKLNRLTWEKQTPAGLNETFAYLRRFFSEKYLIKLLNLNYANLEDFFLSLKLNPLNTTEQLRNSMPDYKDLSNILPNKQWQAWTSSLRTVSHDSSMPMSIEILKSLHKMAYPSGSDFKSFYQFKIQNLNEGRTKRDALRLFESGDITGLRQLLNLEEPIGVFRTGPIYITRPGSSSESQQGSHFTEETIYKLLANPNLKVQVISSSPSGVKAKIILPEIPNIESDIRELINSTNKALEFIKSDSHLNRSDYVDKVIQVASDFLGNFRQDIFFGTVLEESLVLRGIGCLNIWDFLLRPTLQKMIGS